MAVTKPYKFIGFEAMAVTKPYNFLGFVAMAVPSPRGSSPVFAFVFALGSPRGPGWVRSVIFLRRSSALGRFLSDLWGGIMDLLFSCWPAAQGIGGHCRSPRGHHGPHSTPQQNNKKHFRRVAHDFQVGLDPKPYKFIGFGAMDVTKPYEFISFGAMDGTKPYEFTGFRTPSIDDLGPDRAQCIVSASGRVLGRRVSEAALPTGTAEPPVGLKPAA
jgi:hypothetical protein